MFFFFFLFVKHKYIYARGEMKYMNVQQQQQYTALRFVVSTPLSTIFYYVVYLLYLIHVYVAAYLYIYRKVL